MHYQYSMFYNTVQHYFLIYYLLVILISVAFILLCTEGLFSKFNIPRQYFQIHLMRSPTRFQMLRRDTRTLHVLGILSPRFLKWVHLVHLVTSFSKHREGREGIPNNLKVANTDIISPRIRKKQVETFLFSVTLQSFEQWGKIKIQGIQTGRSHIIPVCIWHEPTFKQLQKTCSRIQNQHEKKHFFYITVMYTIQKKGEKHFFFSQWLQK